MSDGYIIEAALARGFMPIDDEAEVFSCTEEQLLAFAREPLAEIERLREALQEMLSVAEVDQLENLSICDVGSERAKMKNRAVASRCGMLLGKLRKIARAALGEGKE